MATRVIMPAFGTTQSTGVLLKWLKREGESVAKGEPLMEVETDKSTVEVEASTAGVLLARRASEGDTVPVGQIIAFIGAAGEAIDDASWLGAIGAAPTANTGAAKIEAIAPKAAAPVTPSAGRVLASPAARRLAKRNSVAIATIRGSGPGGAVLARDLESPANQPAAGMVTPLNAMRRVIAARMSASKQSAPHFYLSMDVNMNTVIRQRERWKTAGSESVPSINDLIVAACAQSLKAHPLLNSQYRGDQGIERNDAIHIGVAVALDDGLVVPVVRHADRLTLAELAAQTRELIDKAQNKKLTPLDYEGGTFTISNLGMLGVDSFTAIINPPQCAILAVGRVAPRVIAEDDAMAIRPMMTITLSADHRVADGALGARFLQSIKNYLEAGAWDGATGN